MDNMYIVHLLYYNKKYNDNMHMIQQILNEIQYISNRYNLLIHVNDDATITNTIKIVAIERSNRYTFTISYDTSTDYLFLSNLHVNQTERNKKYGTLILSICTHIAKCMNIINIRLTCNKKRSSHIHQWYGDNGFVIISETDAYNLMNKNINEYE